MYRVFGRTICHMQFIVLVSLRIDEMEFSLTRAFETLYSVPAHILEQALIPLPRNSSTALVGLSIKSKLYFQHLRSFLSVNRIIWGFCDLKSDSRGITTNFQHIFSARKPSACTMTNPRNLKIEMKFNSGIPFQLYLYQVIPWNYPRITVKRENNFDSKLGQGCSTPVYGPIAGLELP